MGPTPPPVATLPALGHVVAQLVPGMAFAAPASLAFSDMAALDPKFARHHAREVYPARTARLDAISLVALPPGATVLAGTGFAVRVGRHLVAEQLAPDLRGPAQVAGLLAQAGPLDELEGACVMVARYGAATWGHWLAEILPGLVLAERKFPGRYRYAVPDWEGVPALPGQVEWGPRWGRAVRESLAGHGIGAGRLVWLDPARSTRFRQMHCVTPVWSDRMLHPVAAGAMRLAAEAGGNDAGERVALLRLGPAGRAILNGDEVRSHLERRGFRCVAVGSLPFRDQVAVFRRARLVFGVLGSDLAGLLYAPDGVRVITAAPAGFGDEFFHALIQLRGGRHADLRGVAEAHPAFAAYKHPFRLGVGQIDAALGALG